MLRTISLSVASLFRFMLAGACTSTVTATDCLPSGSRSAAGKGGSPPVRAAAGWSAGAAVACACTTFSSRMGADRCPRQSVSPVFEPDFVALFFVPEACPVWAFCLVAVADDASSPGAVLSSVTDKSRGNGAGTSGGARGTGSAGVASGRGPVRACPGLSTYANSKIPRINKNRRPMDSIPSLGTAPVDATARQYLGPESPGCVKTGRLSAFPLGTTAHRPRIPRGSKSMPGSDNRSAGIKKGQVDFPARFAVGRL